MARPLKVVWANPILQSLTDCYCLTQTTQSYAFKGSLLLPMFIVGNTKTNAVDYEADSIYITCRLPAGKC